MYVSSEHVLNVRNCTVAKRLFVRPPGHMAIRFTLWHRPLPLTRRSRLPCPWNITVCLTSPHLHKQPTNYSLLFDSLTTIHFLSAPQAKRGVALNLKMSRVYIYKFYFLETLVHRSSFNSLQSFFFYIQ